MLVDGDALLLIGDIAAYENVLAFRDIFQCEVAVDVGGGCDSRILDSESRTYDAFAGTGGGYIAADRVLRMGGGGEEREE